MFYEAKVFHLNIEEDTPIFKHLKKIRSNFLPGDYLGEWVPINNAQGHFIIKKDRGNARTTVLSLTIEELTNLLLLCLKHDPDKFTLQEQEIIKQLQNTKRNKKFREGKLEEEVAHHVIPLGVCQRSKLVNAAIRYNNFNPDDPNGENKIFLPASLHPGNHPEYSKEVERILDRQWQYIVEAEAEDAPEVIEDSLTYIINSLKQAIQSLVDAGKTIEDFRT
ncbi:MAG: AHH domain-containing protein [Oscillatoriaceae cyanobacterium Prado104]|jgi:hypothetical protein|nr:AHH domain-containing protein [Oscillatoriaceae cyanobacterium Prado104]